MLHDYTNRSWMKSKRTSLKNTSYDEEHKDYMSDSTLNVIGFDQVKEEYLTREHLEGEMASSVDALVSDGQYTYIIEFKNGNKIESHQIENKLKDSVTILCDEWKRTVSQTRQEIVFVLVYNEEKKHLSDEQKRFIALANNSGVGHKDFGLEKANMYVKKALIYNRQDFKTKLLSKLKAV